MKATRALTARRLTASSILTTLTAVTASAALATPAPSANSPRPVANPTTTNPPPLPSPGSPGMNDPYFPDYGNGGYDALHYAINLTWAPNTKTPEDSSISGSTDLTAKATKLLSAFNVDFALELDSVTVNGQPATFKRVTPRDITITPASPIREGETMKVHFAYKGTPHAVKINNFTPWFPDNEGGGVINGEPEVSAWWFPSNDHPRDKATFEMAITAPKEWQVISNGRLRSAKPAGDQAKTWKWESTSQMATYLPFFAVGKFVITQGKTKSGLPWLNAYAKRFDEREPERVKWVKSDLAATPKVIDWLASKYGPYPFDAIGGVVPDNTFSKRFSLENQTRPVYTAAHWNDGDNVPKKPGLDLIVHENAHQWFGNSVSVANWKDTWLNEGFATWAEWAWIDDHPTKKGEHYSKEMLAMWWHDTKKEADFWTVKLSDPTKEKMFDGQVYNRGVMVLAALKRRVGDEKFAAILKTWAATRANGNASVEDFTQHASKTSGQDLTQFFDAWLNQTKPPAPTKEMGLDEAEATPQTEQSRARAKETRDRAANRHKHESQLPHNH